MANVPNVVDVVLLSCACQMQKYQKLSKIDAAFATLQERQKPIVSDMITIRICPFLSEEKKCQIYEVRPEICRRFICSKYQNVDNQPLNHRNKKIINMITTFNQTGTCPNAPNLKELNKFYEEKKKEVYG